MSSNKWGSSSKRRPDAISDTAETAAEHPPTAAAKDAGQPETPVRCPEPSGQSIH
jgi:hypothetical protein